jgi:hypothetical protein
MRVDPTKIVAKFLRIKKDEKNDLNYSTMISMSMH